MRRAAMIGMAAAAAAAGAQTRQQAYQAAQQALDQGQWQAAADGFRPLLAAPGKTSRTDGMLRARYAIALLRLDAADEAEAEAARAVVEFPADPKDEERRAAMFALAQARWAQLKLTDAAAAFARIVAESPAGSAEWREAALDLALAARTVDPRQAEAAAAMLIAEANGRPAASKAEQAQIIALQGMARLNAGDAEGALAIMRRAIALTGGLGGASLNSVQASVRQDAALVMLRGGHPDDAREALAFGGGGYMPDSSWLMPKDNDLPVCGDQIRPDDVAVIELSVDEEGATSRIRPVFASRPGAVGEAFARQVRTWRFAPGTMRDVKPFWRSGVRLELRCVSRPASLAIGRAAREAGDAWLTSVGLRPAAETGGPGSLGVVRPSTPAVAAFAATFARTREHVPIAARRASPEEVLAAAGAAGAPALAAASLAERSLPWRGGPVESAAARATALARLADRVALLPDGAAAAAWLDVETALQLETAGSFGAAGPRLDRALATPPAALPAGDPVRVVATLHRALVDRQLGAATAAEARLRAAGLDAEQCSLFDVHPLPVNASVSSNDFPNEAMRWRMEGFAQTAFDIAADGHVTGVRTIRAYPPFVFGPATEKAMARFRYLPPTLNSVALGCSAMRQSIRFQIPGR